MIDCDLFFESLEKYQLGIYTGVPDSLLKPICTCITERCPTERHIIAANEGAAIGLATGNYLASGKPSLVYMQNSGLGNAINPLLSLTDPKVYAIPMLLLIGWRGEPGVVDEPQHIKQGEVTLELLNTLGIPYEILPDQTQDACESLERMLEKSVSLSQPTALVVRKNTFAPYDSPNLTSNNIKSFPMSREQALATVLKELTADDVLVSTTGMTSREIYELRTSSQEPHYQDFLTVGSMGHCSQIAMGITLSDSRKRVICIDGDGSLIMHMGSLAVIGQTPSDKGIVHIVINNGKHDSVGGQPTVGHDIDLPLIATACGYKQAISVSDEEKLICAIRALETSKLPAMIEIKVHSGARADLGRPTTSPLHNKNDFMDHLQNKS